MGQVLAGTREVPVAAGQRANELLTEGDNGGATSCMTGQNVLVDSGINGPCGKVGMSRS